MWAEVQKLRLDGRVLHRGWWGSQTLFRGRLKVEQRLDAARRRYSMQAWMSYSAHEDVEQLGVLYDAQLVKVEGDVLILSGFEREPMMQRDVAQAWMVRPVSYEATTAARDGAGTRPTGASDSAAPASTPTGGNADVQ